MGLTMPKTCLVILCGVAGSGKSTFAAKHFKLTEIVSSDTCRAIISDDEGNIYASKEAFELFYFIIEKRMKMGKLIVADSTALSYDARKKLLDLSSQNNYYTVFIAFDIPVDKCIERNNMRSRKVSKEVIQRQHGLFLKSLGYVDKEGYDQIIIMNNDDDVDNFSVTSNSERTINLNDYLEVTYLKYKDDEKIRFNSEEIKEIVDSLSSGCQNPSWMVYVPPINPSINNCSLELQVCDSIRFYRRRGMHRIIIQPINTSSTYVFIICKDKECGDSYFMEAKIGEIYSPPNSIFLDDNIKIEIISKIQNDFTNSGYFENLNTEFIIFEARIEQNERLHKIIPLKLISQSFTTLLNKDNLWQIDNINKLCENSGFLSKPKYYIIEGNEDNPPIITKLINEGYNEFIIKPVKSKPEFKGSIIQPEIVCTYSPVSIGDAGFKLSTLAYLLSAEGLEKFIKYKSGKKYFRYIIGCMVVNNRIVKLKE